MNKLILFIILVSMPVLAEERYYHYMDCVKVVSGFFEGCKGKTVSWRYVGEVTYSVELQCKGHSTIESFISLDLRPAKGCL